jgi:hypothetical protein
MRGIMRQILSFSEHLSEDEVQQLTTVLIFHLVEKCGGQVCFSADDANRILSGLTTKMVHMQIGNDVTLRIVTRPPELL